MQCAKMHHLDDSPIPSTHWYIMSLHFPLMWFKCFLKHSTGNILSSIPTLEVGGINVNLNNGVLGSTQGMITLSSCSGLKVTMWFDHEKFHAQ